MNQYIGQHPWMVQLGFYPDGVMLDQGGDTLDHDSDMLDQGGDMMRIRSEQSVGI